MSWNTIKASLQQRLPESEYSLWIKPLECRQEEGGHLELDAPDRFFCAWVEDRYMGLIREQIERMGTGLKVRLGVSSNPPLQIECSRSGQFKLPGVGPVPRMRSLHPAFTFDQFMVGESNLLARSACKALATGDRTFGNCLFINSSTGLGKSHLSQAVVHQVLHSAPSTRLHYLSAQQFAAEMVKGIRTKTMDDFSKKYINHCDMLLVEDVHTLKGKVKTQEELNIILDYLLKSGRRVILTSAQAPGNLEGIDDDFRSRMSAGLVTGIESPDYETRARIIRHKLSLHGISADDEVLAYMAKRLEGDVRRMESAVLGIKARTCLCKAPLDLAMAKAVLGNLLCQPAALNGEGIRDFIGKQFKVSIEDLCSRSRKRSVAFPRQVAMYLTRKYTKSSLAEIGGIYNRDHSTVLHAIKSITQDMARETSIRSQVEQLCAGLEE